MELGRSGGASEEGGEGDLDLGVVEGEPRRQQALGSTRFPQSSNPSAAGPRRTHSTNGGIARTAGRWRARPRSSLVVGNKQARRVAGLLCVVAGAKG